MLLNRAPNRRSPVYRTSKIHDAAATDYSINIFKRALATQFTKYIKNFFDPKVAVEPSLSSAISMRERTTQYNGMTES
jgi:hypothetical protein